MKLYPFQDQGIRQLNRFGGRGLLADQVGLGKSLQALAYAKRYVPESPAGPIVIVCPSHLKIHWERESKRVLPYEVEILNGQRVPEGYKPPGGNRVYVVNYDVLVPPNWGSRTPLPADSWTAWLLQQNPRILIADEAHYCKSASTARTRAVKKLARQIPYMLALSGTPLTNKPTDLWPVLNLLRPDLWPSQWDFNCSYTHAISRWYGWEFKGAKNLDTLHDTLSRTVMVRRRKEDVLEDLPEITQTVIPVDVDLRDYRKAEANFILWLRQEAPTLAPSAAKALELTRLNYLKEMAGKLKTPAVADLVRDHVESNGKMLVGAVHHSVTKALLGGIGPKKCVLVNGEMTHKQKTAAFDKFNSDPKCEVLVGNLQSAGTGWSCTSTSDCLLAELPWVPVDVTQFIGRVHGIKRGLSGVGVNAKIMVARGTVDEDLCEALQRKDGWAATAIDGDPEASAMNVHDQCIAAMKRRHQ